MKKVTKGLIIAASVAAVVGVSAVSFAAWSDSGNKSATVTGATGQIATVGAITVSPTSDSGTLTSLKPLCPVDQTTAPDGCVKYWEFNLSTSATGTPTVKYTIKGSISQGSEDNKGTALGDAELRWSTTTPSKDSGTEVSATAADITGTKVYVYLVANNTEAMNADISLTFTAEEVTSGT